MTMLLNTLTLAERERLAYAEGFTTTAALLAQASDDALDLEVEQERQEIADHNEGYTDGLKNDLARLKDQLFTMRELVEQAADYLKDGDVDRAGCTLSEALK
jgi:hypothetical protein